MNTFRNERFPNFTWLMELFRSLDLESYAQGLADKAEGLQDEFGDEGMCGLEAHIRRLRADLMPVQKGWH